MNFVNSIIIDIIDIALFYSHPDQAGIIIKTTFLNDKTVLCPSKI